VCERFVKRSNIATRCEQTQNFIVPEYSSFVLHKKFAFLRSFQQRTW